MAIKNKNGKSISKNKIEIKTITQQNDVVIEKEQVQEEKKVVENKRRNTGQKKELKTKQPIETNILITNIEKPQKIKVNNEIKTEMLSLKKALLSVYNKQRIYVTRNYINSQNNYFVEANTLLGFKHEKEQITIKAELVDANNVLCICDNLRIIIKKNGEDFNYALLEKTSLERSNKVVFQTTQTESCVFQITFILTLENNETVEYVKEVVYTAYNKVVVGYLDRHDKKYKFIENEDITPSSTCKGNTYEIKLYKLPVTKENHGERICLCIPHDLYINDEGNYSFYYNGFQMPLFLEEEININNEKYYVFVSTSYYENDNNEIYDFSIKIEVA